MRKEPSIVVRESEGIGAVPPGPTGCGIPRRLRGTLESAAMARFAELPVSRTQGRFNASLWKKSAPR